MDSKFAEEPETEQEDIQATQSTPPDDDEADIVPVQYLVTDQSKTAEDDDGFDATAFDHLEENAAFRNASATGIIQLDTDSDLIDLDGEDEEIPASQPTSMPQAPAEDTLAEEDEEVDESEAEEAEDDSADSQDDEQAEPDDQEKPLPRNRTTRMMSPKGKRNTTSLNSISARRDTTRIKAEEENVPAWVKRKREKNKKTAKLIILGIEAGMVLGGILLITFALPRFLPDTFPNGLPPWSWILSQEEEVYTPQPVQEQTASNQTETETENETEEDDPAPAKKSNIDPSTFRASLDKLIETGNKAEELRNNGETEAALKLLEKFFRAAEKLSDQMYEAGEDQSEIGLEYNKLFKKYSRLQSTMQDEVSGGF